MSKLLITRDDIRRAVEKYYKYYEPELFKQFNFDIMHFYHRGNHDNIGNIEYIVEERSDV